MEELVQKVDGAKQEINTGMTLHEMYSRQAAAMEALDHKEIHEHFVETIADYIESNFGEMFILNSKETNYVTLFPRDKQSHYALAHTVVDFIFEELPNLKMYSDEDNVAMVQMYIGGQHFAFFNCDHLIVR